MFIIIKDNCLIEKYILGEYFLYKGIEIYFKNDNYYINLKDNYYFSDNRKCCELSLQKYEVHNDDVYYSIEIYVYEIAIGIDDFKLYENQKVLIAANENANIVCRDYYLKDYYLYIADGYLKSNFDISFNGNSYDNEVLKDGDIIELLGIKIIYYADYLYINNFNVENHLIEYENHQMVIRYADNISIPNYYIPNDLLDLHIEKVDEFAPPKKNNFNDFIKSIIPNLVMSFSMLAMASISFYSSIINNQPKYTRLSYILMPISMLLTGIIIPIIFYRYDLYQYKQSYKQCKDKYLTYLQNYSDKLAKDITTFLTSYNCRYFDFEDSINKMFYANRNSFEYLKLSLGKQIISRELNYKISGDIDIDECLNKIKDRLNYIDNFPLFLDIQARKIITIVSKNIDKYYLFNKFILELAFKHHYVDLNMAIYSKSSLVFDDMFNLPHLFINNRRLTLNSNKQIQELDQMKLDKPLVLFLYDYLEFNFTNKNIYVIYFSTDIENLYRDSNCVVEYLNNKAYLYDDKRQTFSFVIRDLDFSDYYKYLGRLRNYGSSDKTIHFKDIYNEDIITYYQNNNRTLSACFAYNGGELLNFDLHESKQGPHGLIGGCTGSGKSELIISLLLSLCIRYSPEYLNIVLIDYKGGGIKESLTYKGIALPHIVAAVSNLENNSLERLIIALNNECKKRQSLFKSLSTLSNGSIMNIDDYLEGGYEKYGLSGLAHLLIVVDEFAQLKKEQPQEIKDLISISRIGRSLGLHLILATQKPSGVIDEEIWSNSHFKIVLKVFDEKDSVDIIKRNDGAYLNKSGSFLMQVDDSLIKAQCIYAKNDYYGNDAYKVSLLDNTLDKVKSFNNQNGQTISECSVYTRKIIETCNKYKLKAKQLDFMMLASKNRKTLTESECLVFGESDDYFNSKRSLVAYGLKESVLLYSTRPNEINSFLNTFNEFNRHCIVIGNKRYSGSSISDSLLYDEQESVEYLLDFLLNNSNHNLTLVIEDLNCFLSYDETTLDKLCKLCRRSKTINLSLLFITSNSQLSFKLINYFDKRVLININETSDIFAFYGGRSKYEGNSYYFKNEPITFVPIKIEAYHESTCTLVPLVKKIPEIIEPLIKDNYYLLGYDLANKEQVFSDDKLIILSLDETLLKKYSKYKDIEMHIYDYHLKVELNRDILWLGPGIFNQRLFIASNKVDLTYEQGLFIGKGRKQVIRSINTCMNN